MSLWFRFNAWWEKDYKSTTEGEKKKILGQGHKVTCAILAWWMTGIAALPVSVCELRGWTWHSIIGATQLVPIPIINQGTDEQMDTTNKMKGHRKCSCQSDTRQKRLQKACSQNPVYSNQSSGHWRQEWDSLTSDQCRRLNELRPEVLLVDRRGRQLLGPPRQ